MLHTLVTCAYDELTPEIGREIAEVHSYILNCLWILTRLLVFCLEAILWK